MRENIRVVVRFRPLNQRERSNLKGQDFHLQISNNSVKIGQGGIRDNHEFTFDNVFDQKSTQSEIFDGVAKNVVDWVTKGYNATIFAYGMTGAGKSFTMFGDKEHDRGIIPRSCELLFKLIEGNSDIVETTVKVSFLEIYRERIRDLQRPAPMGVNKIPTLRIRQSTEKGIYVQGLMEKYVYTPKDILDTIEKSTSHRATASTVMNDTSSRSHAVLTIILSQTMIDGTVKVSKLNMVDLAGSEDVGKSEVTGANLIEAQTINKSLSALGNVIVALTEKGRVHIPYRDSRLTYLLQDSLGGNSKSTLIAAVTPDKNSYVETLSTLKFAKRTKQIKNVPMVNSHRSNASLHVIIETLHKKIKDLEEKCEDYRVIIQKVSNCNTEESNTEESAIVGVQTRVVLTTRIKRLTTKLEASEKLHNADIERYISIKEIFDKQRSLAQAASMDLYNEKMMVCLMSNELKEYKMFYESLKESVDTPDILGNIIKNTSIKSRKLSVLTTGVDITPVVNVEIDSPPM